MMLIEFEVDVLVLPESEADFGRVRIGCLLLAVISTSIMFYLI